MKISLLVRSTKSTVLVHILFTMDTAWLAVHEVLWITTAENYHVHSQVFLYLCLSVLFPKAFDKKFTFKFVKMDRILKRSTDNCLVPLSFVVHTDFNSRSRSNWPYLIQQEIPLIIYLLHFMELLKVSYRSFIVILFVNGNIYLDGKTNGQQSSKSSTTNGIHHVTNSNVSVLVDHF